MITSAQVSAVHRMTKAQLIAWLGTFGNFADGEPLDRWSKDELASEVLNRKSELHEIAAYVARTWSMTAPDVAPLICPQCGSTNTSIGGSGNGMCFECANTWNPATVTALRRPAVQPFGMAPVEDVYGVPPALRDAGWDETGSLVLDIADLGHSAESIRPGDVLDGLVGGFATLEGGQVAQVVTFTDDERVVVTLANGDTEIVPLADVERIVPPVADVALDTPSAAGEDAPVEQQATMVMAAAILDAGIRASYALANPGSLVDIPSGYLPDDPDLRGFIDQACVIAVGMLIDATDTTPAELAAFFGIDIGPGE